MFSPLKKAIPIALFCVVWEVACIVLKIPDYIVPAPHRVVQKIIESAHLLYVHSLTSMAEIVLGFVLASICALLCAIAVVHSRRVEAVLEPFLVVSQVIPKVALAPLFIIWFGHGILPKIIIAMLIAFFPVLVNAVVGLRSIDPEILELIEIDRREQEADVLAGPAAQFAPLYLSGTESRGSSQHRWSDGR